MKTIAAPANELASVDFASGAERELMARPMAA